MLALDVNRRLSAGNERFQTEDKECTSTEPDANSETTAAVSSFFTLYCLRFSQDFCFSRRGQINRAQCGAWDLKLKAKSPGY